MGLSHQAFYQWRATFVLNRDGADAHLINAALNVHQGDPVFGYRFIANELEEQTSSAGENRVSVCAAVSRSGPFAKERGINRKAGPPVHDGHVQRGFTATEPDRLWLTDITERCSDEGKLCLCAIKDVYPNRTVGYSIDSPMKASLAFAALHHAIARKDAQGTLIRSDRGSQFRSNAFVRTLGTNGLKGPRGRVGACAENAAIESFFALLQKNVLDRQRWTTRANLRLAIVT